MDRWSQERRRPLLRASIGSQTLTGFYDAIKPQRAYDVDDVRVLLQKVSEERVRLLASNLSAYLSVNLRAAILAKEAWPITGRTLTS